MKNERLAVAGAILAALVSHTASAAPQYFPGTGHYYDVITDMSLPDWSEARVLAEQQTWQGMNGYLACITSAEENEFIFQLTLGTTIWHHSTVWEIGPWLGGYQAPGSGEPDEGWTWVNGEPWGYSAWLDGQPDDNGYLGANEMALCYWAHSGTHTPTWNDYTDSPPGPSGRVYGYVVEFGEDPISTHRTSWGEIKAAFR